LLSHDRRVLKHDVWTAVATDRLARQVRRGVVARNTAGTDISGAVAHRLLGTVATVAGPAEPGRFQGSAFRSVAVQPGHKRVEPDPLTAHSTASVLVEGESKRGLSRPP